MSKLKSMSAKHLETLLLSLGACEDALLWSEGKTLKVAWSTCDRGDWLLWLAGRMEGREGWVTRQELVLAACDCAELSLKYVKDREDRPRIAIETTRKWARGEATLEEVRIARRAAYDAGYDAGYAAADTAAAYAAVADTAAAYAADVAGTSRAETLKRCAELVRARLHPKAVL